VRSCIADQARASTPMGSFPTDAEDGQMAVNCDSAVLCLHYSIRNSRWMPCNTGIAIYALMKERPGLRNADNVLTRAPYCRDCLRVEASTITRYWDPHYLRHQLGCVDKAKRMLIVQGYSSRPRASLVIRNLLVRDPSSSGLLT
jgi:hypothetical protein